MTEKTGDSLNFEDLKKFLSGRVEAEDKKRGGLDSGLLKENEFLRKELARLKVELGEMAQKAADSFSPEGNSGLNKIIREKALQALMNFQKEYETRKRLIEAEALAAKSALEKERELIGATKQEVEKEKSDFREFAEKEKQELDKLREELTSRIQAQERERWEKLFLEKEKLLIGREKEFLESLIKSFETET